MMRALALCLLSAGARAFVWPHASTGGGRGRPASAASASAPSDDEEGLMVTIAKVRRPLGVILEEREGGRGVEVLDIDPRGNAAGEDVLVGDRVLMVDAAQCADAWMVRFSIASARLPAATSPSS